MYQKVSDIKKEVEKKDEAELFNSLPENAQKYYKEKSNVTLDGIISNLSMTENVKKYISGAFLLPPLVTTRYANANQLLPVLINGKHKLLKGPLFHWQTGVMDRVGKAIDISADVNFGSIKLVYVKPGCVRYATNIEKSKPILLGPGMHFFDDNSTIISPDDVGLTSGGQNKIIRLDDKGIFSFVFVKTGSQGVMNSRDGEIKVLESGLHFIEAPDAFVQFASIQQEHLTFGSCASNNNQVFLTADNVELHVLATLFYNISDVKKVYTTSIKDQNDLIETIHSQALSTLMTIIRSENFSNIGKKEMMKSANSFAAASHHEEKDDYEDEEENVVMAVPVPSAPPALVNNVANGFQAIIHDAEPRFKTTMQKNFGDRVGFCIQSLRIEKIEFADKLMQKQVSELAMSNTKLSAQEATIMAQRKVQTAEAEREAATLLIKARAEANRKMIEQDTINAINMKKVDADNEILLKTTNAKMEASKLAAITDSENKILLAKAEANSIIEVGNAEVEIISKKNALPNAQLRIVTDAHVESLKGISKVIYADNKQPFILGGLASIDAYPDKVTA